MRAFFEGPAGSGKTFRLIECAQRIVATGALNGGTRLLALTFMNGAKRRLTEKLATHPAFRGRFRCITFDSFARMLVARRRAVLREMSDAIEGARSMNEFDGACFLASRLLVQPNIAAWVAASHPIAIVDEAQDLDEHRFAMLRALDVKCEMLAAADEFQCLDPRHLSTVQDVINWLRGAREATPLNHVVRTSQVGILKVALAVREGRSILDQLSALEGSFNPTRSAPGFRLIETHAKNSGHAAWTIGNELRQLTSEVAILTPDSQHRLIREALEKVCTQAFNLNKVNRTTFGPFTGLEWEISDDERASAVIRKLQLADTMSCADAMSALAVFSSEAEVAQTLQRLGRLRRVSGRQTICSTEVEAMIRTISRELSRHRGPHPSRLKAMTIHAAKNREFDNVVVLWPHTAPADPDQARRLLYNAITRARRRCSVVVFGKNRLQNPPFSM